MESFTSAIRAESMFNKIYENNRKTSKDVQKLLNYYKLTNYDELKKHLNDHTSRIIWQKNENCHLRKYLNELKYAPLKEATKIQLLKNIHQRFFNLTSYTNTTEYEIENTCSSIKNDACDPLSLIDYALNNENNEINEFNTLSVELKTTTKLLTTSNLGIEETVRYLSGRIRGNADANAVLKSQLESIDSSIQRYEESLFGGVVEPSESSSSDTDDTLEELMPASNASVGDLMVTKWELIPYDISKLLHKDIDMTIEQIRDKYIKIIQTHRISEKLFCKAVLNTTSKVIKRLFSLKTSWETMKAKDRIIMLRVYMWINDVDGVKKLRDWTNQIKTIELDNEQISSGDAIDGGGSGEELTVINYDINNLVLPEGMDAQQICVDFKKAIENHGISQKLYAKAVLNVAQSTISKFLSRPKQYYETNSLAKSTYLKMYAWLNDEKGIEKIQKWTEKWKWNEHTQNEIDILEEINRTKHENNIDYDTFDLSITKKITTREIRDMLKADLEANRISQKLFAKAVLNKAESTLSLLLSNPNTWDTLNLKSKEKYLQIYKWLIDPERLIRLDTWEKKENEKRTRMSKLYTKSTKAVLSRQEEMQLTKSFQINMYPGREQMQLIATRLNINLIKVINWFNHKRRKYNMQKRMISNTNKMQRQQLNNKNKVNDLTKQQQQQQKHDDSVVCIKIEQTA